MLRELESIRDKLKEERAILERTIAPLGDAEAAQIFVTPEWSVKDEIAHLAGAERGMLRIAQRIARNENPELPEGYNNDEYNARQVAKRKNQTLAEIKAELDGSRAELIELLASVASDQLNLRGEHPLAGDVSLKDLLVVIYSHETTHAKEIADKVRQARK